LLTKHPLIFARDTQKSGGVLGFDDNAKGEPARCSSGFDDLAKGYFHFRI